MSTPVFKNKSGMLTRYALACGYIELAEHNNIRTQLLLDCNSYAVKTFDHNTGTRLVWDNYNSLVAARKRYRELIRTYK